MEITESNGCTYINNVNYWVQDKIFQQCKTSLLKDLTCAWFILHSLAKSYARYCLAPVSTVIDSWLPNLKFYNLYHIGIYKFYIFNKSFIHFTTINQTITTFQLLKELTRAFLDEAAAPKLLPEKLEMVDKMVFQMASIDKILAASSNKNGPICAAHRMELYRIEHVVNSYLRSTKIENHWIIFQ